jgi:nucleotide-binding universal stress UspA family protein
MKSSAASLHPRRILVPVDFSESSEPALKFAAKLAAGFKAELSLLHVIEPCLPTGDLALDLARMRIDFKKGAQRRLEELLKRCSMACRAVVRAGSPSQQILEEAEEIGADLIVIGTHGRTGLPHLLIGSVAERVLRLAYCPVLVLPLKNELNRLGRRRLDRQPEVAA